MKKLTWPTVGLACLALMCLALAIRIVERDHSAKISLGHRLFVENLAGRVSFSEHMIAMPDGIRLATDIYVPIAGEDKKPVILVRLPYGKRDYGEAKHWVKTFASQGYAVVVQDMRGRYRSEGVFTPYPHEAEDGARTLDWIAGQAWSNGRVGTIGCSALGEAQILLATQRHPAHQAMIAMGAGGSIGTADNSFGFFGFFEGGIMNLASSFGWFVSQGGKTGKAMHAPQVDYRAALRTLPVIDAVAAYRKDPTDYEMLQQGFEDPEIHTKWGYISGEETFAVPSLLVDTWYDYGVSFSLSLARQIASTSPSGHLVIAPGTHCDIEGAFVSGAVGDIAVSAASRISFDEMFVNFMDHHLKGQGHAVMAPFQTYIMQEDVWLTSDAWPPAKARTRTFFLAGNALSDVRPLDGSSRQFLSNPSKPIPSLGGALCCTGDPNSRSGPVLQNAIEDRDDLLIYTSPILEEPIRIAGPLKAQLKVSANVPDTDLIVRLTDVDPNGNSVLIQEGALRLRYREGFEKPRMMISGES